MVSVGSVSGHDAVKSQVGKMFGRWRLGAEATAFGAGEKSQDYQARGIFFYYF